MNRCTTGRSASLAWSFLISAGVLPLVLGLGSTTFPTASHAELHSVDDRIAPFVVGPRFDRRTRRHLAEVRLRNHSAYSVFAPFRVVLEGLSATDLVNRDGVNAAGEPYVTIDLPDGQLAPGERWRGAPLELAGRALFSTRTEATRFKLDALVAAPFALSAAPVAGGAPSDQEVVFTIGTTLNEDPTKVNLVLERLDGLVGPSGPFAMRDDGQDGDTIAGDGRYSVAVTFPGGTLHDGDQSRWQVRADVGGFPAHSNELMLAVTSLPIRAADSDLAGNVVTGVLGGANAHMRFVANEVLVRFPPATTEDVILAAIDSALAVSALGTIGVSAEIVGSILPLETFQIRTNRPLTHLELRALIDAFQAQPEVTDAFGNALLEPVAVPNDPGLVPGDPLEQQAISLINVPEVWEHTSGVRGNGSAVRVRVLDTGYDIAHPDLGLLVGDGEVALSGSKAGHGTRMSGIIGATADNATGIAGVAHQAEVEVDQVLAANGVVDTSASGDTPAWTLGQILMDLAVEPSATRPEVVNISYAGRWEPGFAGDAYKVGYLCRGVRQATDAGVMIVAAAGNNTDTGATSFAYPGRCNVDTGLDAGDQVVQKQRLVTVANTTLADTLNATSLSGSYVDVAIPGTDVVSTTIGATYNRVSGTSEAAAIGSGSVALLLAAGADKDQVEGALKTTGAFLPVLGYERVDVLAALVLLNQPPSIGTNAFSVPENQTAVGNIVATDPEGFGLTYSISPGGDGGQFTLDPATGALGFAASPDFEAPADANGDNIYQLTVQVADGPAASPATQTQSAPVTVTVTDVIESSTLVLDQQSLADLGTTYSCGNGNVDSLFQGFVPTTTPLGAVEIKLRAGGSFPAGGATTTVRIRQATPDGAILATRALTVNAPPSETVFPRFEFPSAVNVVPGQTYYIEWIHDGPAILSWFGLDQPPDGPYAAATAAGCGAFGPRPSIDQVFRTFSLLP